MITKLLFAVALVLSVQSASRAQNILILEDGGTQDSVYSILSEAGFNVTLGGPYWQYTGVDIDQYRLVVFLNGVTYSLVMPDSVQLKIRSYVGNGGDISGKHKLEGIGAGFVPSICRLDLADEIIAVKDDDAYETARKLAKMEGIFGGITSGANVWAAIQRARIIGGGKIIVTVIVDSGLKYLKGDLYK